MIKPFREVYLVHVSIPDFEGRHPDDGVFGPCETVSEAKKLMAWIREDLKQPDYYSGPDDSPPPKFKIKILTYELKEK